MGNAEQKLADLVQVVRALIDEVDRSHLLALISPDLAQGFPGRFRDVREQCAAAEALLEFLAQD